MPNVGTDSVDVIDTRTNTILATIPVGDGPRATAITPDGRLVYVVNKNDDTVSVIDLATRAVVGSPIPVGVGPYTIAITPDGKKAYVGNNDGGTVSVIDLTTHAVTTIAPPSLAFPNTPIDMVITPDGATVYVVATNSGLVPIDVATDTAGALIPTGQATCVALHGQTAWVGQMDSFVLVDLSSSMVIDTLPMGTSHYDLAISPNGAYAYAVSSSSDVLTVIDTATRIVIATVPVGLDPASVAFALDGSTAYVANASSGTISFIDTDSHAIIGVPIPVGGSPAGSGGSFMSPNIVVPGAAVTIANDGTFGAVPFGAFVPFNGGPMQATADWTTTRTVSLLAQGGTLDTNGFDVTLAGRVINDGMLTKSGAGTLTLSGTSTHAGGTIIAADGGTLIVNGTHSGPISIGSDATLGGSGTVGDILTSLGTIAPGGLAPGVTTGILHAANLHLWALAHVNIEMKGGIAGTDYDQIVVSGTAALEDATLASAAVATRVESTRPIIAERSQYWGTPAWIEAHNSAGVTAAAPRWGLAEGRVGGPDAAQTYILLANPNTDADAAATVTITFLRADGGTVVKQFTVPPASRFNVSVIPSAESMAPELIDESFGTLIESTHPIVVERSLYTNANGVTWAAGTNATATRLP